MLSRLRSQIPLWRRALRRRRRTLAALALAVLLASIAPSLLPPSTHGITVATARDDLPIGTVLAPEDLTMVRVAARLVPVGAVQEPADLVGRTVTVPVPAGTAVLEPMLEDPAASAVPEGSALVAVPAPEALTAHLRPGTAVALQLSDPITGQSREVEGVVLQAPAAAADSPLPGNAAGGGAPMIVQVSRADVGEVAHSLTAGGVTVTVIG
ncbi:MULTISPECIES: SAF domain-containing protein [unclassified Brachybacterium]|uniref:SAF domain-containing protein n=1 Tax=unclassified Brachybacterium TaxID=2623841 RepID=UPI000C80381E|nr:MULTISPECIES: SAF domain-containing protein [unclassified Brachybacterium]PMC74613.1 hypothetical protein CJ197_12355 [Brachybacterium sp. UMB0905]